MSVTMPKPRDKLFGLVIGRTGIPSFKFRQEGKEGYTHILHTAGLRRIMLEGVVESLRDRRWYI